MVEPSLLVYTMTCQDSGALIRQKTPSEATYTPHKENLQRFVENSLVDMKTPDLNRVYQRIVIGKYAVPSFAFLDSHLSAPAKKGSATDRKIP